MSTEIMTIASSTEAGEAEVPANIAPEAHTGAIPADRRSTHGAALGAIRHEGDELVVREAPPAVRRVRQGV